MMQPMLLRTILSCLMLAAACYSAAAQTLKSQPLDKQLTLAKVGDVDAQFEVGAAYDERKVADGRLDREAKGEVTYKFDEHWSAGTGGPYNRRCQPVCWRTRQRPSPCERSRWRPESCPAVTVLRAGGASSRGVAVRRAVRAARGWRRARAECAASARVAWPRRGSAAGRELDRPVRSSRPVATPPGRVRTHPPN